MNEDIPYFKHKMKQAIKDMGEDYVKEMLKQQEVDFSVDNVDRASKLMTKFECVSINLQYSSKLMGGKEMIKDKSEGASLASAFFSELGATLAMRLQAAFEVNTEHLTFDNRNEVQDVIARFIDFAMLIGGVGSLVNKDVEFESDFLVFEEQIEYIHIGIVKAGACRCKQCGCGGVCSCDK